VRRARAKAHQSYLPDGCLEVMPHRQAEGRGGG
jgi:hypothetical protein